MRFRALLDNQKRAAFLSDIQKEIKNAFRAKQETTPVFVFGRQRSGTSMLMFAFHMHPETVVFDEHKNSIAFEKHQIRNFSVIENIIEDAKAPFACFKPICDSHRISEFIDRFPTSKNIWIYRNYKTAALSALKKFPHATRAIRLVCTGRTGGGWFQEGVSPATAETLRKVYSDKLTDYDLSCLAWWARNQIFIENNIADNPRVILVKYENLIQNGEKELAWVFDQADLPMYRKCARFLQGFRASGADVPAPDSTVDELCKATLDQMDTYYRCKHDGEAGKLTLNHPGSSSTLPQGTKDQSSLQLP